MSANAYRLVPYQSTPFSPSQPEQLAVIATLFGLAPKPPSKARVLELGCTAGGNLIPLAARYPDAHFVGIDLSPAHVDAARASIARLALKNLDVSQQSIVDMARASEPFDYIICHGVYSWVSPDVQAAILRVCRENLAPDGIAYISYSTFPGWKMREVVRDAMAFHARTVDAPRAKINQARALIKLAQEVADRKTAFGRLLAEEAAVVDQVEDHYLLHDHLRASNRPCYFREFMEGAQAHELAYLGEAVLGDMAPQRLGPKMFNTVQQLSNGDLLATEQYADIFRNRSFRQTLLVPAAAEARIKRRLEPSGMERFWSSCTLTPSPPTESGSAREFKDPQGRSLKTANATVQAMLGTWAERYPQPVSFSELTEGVNRKLGEEGLERSRSTASVGEAMLRFFSEGIAKLHIEPLEVGRARDSHPLAFSVAVEAVCRGLSSVPTMQHECASLSENEREVLMMVDGATNAAQLRERIVERALKRTFTLMRGNVQLTDAEELRPAAAQLVLRSLQVFERAGLLVSNGHEQTKSVAPAAAAAPSGR